jgi:hypothetical protein
MLCADLSAGRLLGLGLNALVGWWWTDPVTALVIAAVAVKEGTRRLAGRVVLHRPHRSGRQRLRSRRLHLSPPQRAYMMIATPIRQTVAPIRSAWSGWKPSKATPHSSEPMMKTPP